MRLTPRFRGFICTAAHPIGCAKNVQDQINVIQAGGPFSGPRRVLVIGASTGYGLATRIAMAFGAQAKTIGIAYEKPPTPGGKRSASPGWYNTAAFETYANEQELYAKSINGDAFSDEIKQQTIDLIQNDWGKVDLVVYSLAAPRRIDPITGVAYQSVLKPIGQPYTGTSVNPLSNELKQVTLEPATTDEIEHTERVMGGDDWQRWIDQLLEANCLSTGAMTIAYSYLGPELTHPIYTAGTIGHAKNHLQKTADQLHQQLASTLGGSAYISVNKALVTQASAAIPVVPLYMSLLFKLMKEQGTHEGCIEQIDRLCRAKLYHGEPICDDQRRIRIDDWEMASDIQQQIHQLWPTITEQNIESITDILGYRHEFYKLFGFDRDDIDYEQPVDLEVNIPSIAPETANQ